MWMKGVEVDKHPEQERSAQIIPRWLNSQNMGAD